MNKQEQISEKIILDFIKAVEEGATFEDSHWNNLAFAMIQKVQKSDKILDKKQLDLCHKVAQKARELTDLFYSAYYKLLDNAVENALLETESYLYSTKDVKQFYTTDEIIAMSDIFNIKTKNTLVAKLNKGEIKGKKVNNKWQITRQALIDYVGHADF